MAPVTRSTLIKQYDRTIIKAIDLGFRSKQAPVFNQFCDVATSDQADEQTTIYEGMRLPQYKPEGGGISYSEPLQGPTKRYVHKTYALGVRMTMEAKQDANMPKLLTGATDLGGVTQHFFEYFTGDLINNGFTTTYHTTGDGAAIFSASHSIAGETFSNLTGPSSLTPATLQAMIYNIRQRKNVRRQPMNLGRRRLKLFYADPLEARVWEILNTMQEWNSANNTENWVARQQIVPVRWSYLTGNQYVLMDTDENDFTFWSRMKPTTSRDGDWESGDALMKVVFRCSVGVNDPRNACGNQGAALT